MKQIHKNYTLLILFSLFIIVSCSKDDEIKLEKLSGYAQKGPFITGTTVEIHELNSALEQTGRVFTTQVYHDAGLFEFNNITLSSRYAEFLVRGQFYDEMSNGFPVTPLVLSALSDVSDKTSVNVNVMTTLEKDRVKYLVNTGLGFADAKSKAQAEVLASFCLKDETIDLSENLDISQDGDGNAILLAISTMTSGVRNQGIDLSSFLGNISSDIEQDGILDDGNVLASVRYFLCRANPSVFRSNLVNRYAYLGVDASIPAFEYYLNPVRPAKPLATVRAVGIITSTSALLHGKVFPNTLNTNAVFEYGTDLNYGSTAVYPSTVSGCLEAEIAVNISGLTPATIYHFRVKATNSLGTSYSTDQQFTTR